MKVNHVLILAAGKGTRMGNIGKVLPKVLWPIYEKSLLSLQINFAKELAPEAKIHINLYHQNELIREKFSHPEASFIVEEEPLDIGGGIHNLAASLGYQGNLLILNGDQFLFFNKLFLTKALSVLDRCDSVLFSFDVNSNEGYNELSAKNNILTNVVLNKNLERNITHATYTGVSLIRLDKLDKDTGESKFFDTIANFKTKKISLIDSSNCEYWDFGTLERYVSSMNKILAAPSSRMKDFLIQSRAIIKSKIKGGHYHSDNGINLSEEYIEDCLSSIVLGIRSRDDLKSKSVVLGDTSETIAQYLE